MGSRFSRRKPETPAQTQPTQVKRHASGRVRSTGHRAPSKPRGAPRGRKESAPKQLPPEAYVPAVTQVTLARLETAYGKPSMELGYQTDGHAAVTEEEEAEAATAGTSLLYGEMLPQGVAKAMDEWHLHAATAQSLVDLGCGTGKLCVQAFLDHSSLTDVFGVEVSAPRYVLGERALVRLAAAFPGEFSLLSFDHGKSVTLGAPILPATLHGHPRLDAEAILAAVAGEAPPGEEEPAPEEEDAVLGGGALHPGDPALQGGASGRRDTAASTPSPRSDQEDGGEAPIRIVPSAAGAGGSSTARGRHPGMAAESGERPKGSTPTSAGAPATSALLQCSVAYEAGAWRTLRLSWGDMFDTVHVGTADIICIETDVPGACYPMLASLMRAARRGARILSYLNLADIWPMEMRRFYNLEQLTINRSAYDRFWTSWSYVNGHKFFLWQVTRTSQPLQVDVRRQRDGTTHVLVAVPPGADRMVGGPLIVRTGSGFAPKTRVTTPSGTLLTGSPCWSWGDVCAVHGAGRRPRLLAYGGQLNDYGGALTPVVDTPLTYIGGASAPAQTDTADSVSVCGSEGGVDAHPPRSSSLSSARFGTAAMHPSGREGDPEGKPAWDTAVQLPGTPVEEAGASHQLPLSGSG